ncbi:MAG TPA: TetR/AcrR family transcriptional regulator [Actinomycetota bacterium]
MKPTAAQRIRAEAKEATRQALLHAGLEGTIEKGGLVPSVESICAAAGFTRGAFYVHFKSRSDFIVEMLGWVVGEVFRTIFVTTTQQYADLAAIVERFTKTLAQRDWPVVVDLRAAYFSVIAGTRESEKVRERHVVLMGAAVDRIEQAFTEAKAAGTVAASVDPRGAAHLTMLLAIGMIVLDDSGVDIDPVGLGAEFLLLLGPRPKR